MESIREVFLPFHYVSVEIEAARSRSNLVWFDVTLCSIEVVISVIQLVQSWFIGIPNPSRIS